MADCGLDHEPQDHGAAPADLKEPGRTWVDEDAGPVLHRVLGVLDTFAEKLSRPIDSYGWLWYARRLHPSIFEGDLATTGPVDWLIFEMMGAKGSKPLPALHDDTLATYPTDDYTLKAVLRLAVVAVRFSETSGTLRRAEKGAVIQAFADRLPKSVPGELDAPIRLYDERMAAHPGLVQGTDLISGQSRSSAEVRLLTVARPYGLRETTGWIGTAAKSGAVSVKGSFALSLLSLDALREMLGRTAAGAEVQQWWEPALPSLVVLLRSLTLHMVTASSAVGINGPKVGYWVTGRANVEGMVHQFLPLTLEGLADIFPGAALPTTGADTVAQVTDMPWSLTPLVPGPVLRGAGVDALIVDLFAATLALNQMLTVPSHLAGDIVNRRALHFELTVQREVDRCDAWRPDASMRAYVGGVVKLNGSAITDLDALGVHGDTLVLISCKSIPYTPEYDAGQFKAVRNVRTNMADNVTAWLKVRDRLRKNPVGDNYDFSRFTTIEGGRVHPDRPLRRKRCGSGEGEAESGLHRSTGLQSPRAGRSDVGDGVSVRLTGYVSRTPGDLAAGRCQDEFGTGAARDGIAARGGADRPCFDDGVTVARRPRTSRAVGRSRGRQDANGCGAVSRRAQTGLQPGGRVRELRRVPRHVSQQLQPRPRLP